MAAQQILPTIETLLTKLGLSLGELEAIAVTIGPGSFTGLRLGVSIAQGLAWAQDIPVIPLTTTEVLAFDALRHTNAARALSAIDARKSEVYWALYAACTDRGVKPLNEIQLTAPETVCTGGHTIDVLIGSAFVAFPALTTMFKGQLVLSPRWPRASCAAQLALLRESDAIRPGDLQPLYIRNDII